MFTVYNYRESIFELSQEVTYIKTYFPCNKFLIYQLNCYRYTYCLLFSEGKDVPYRHYILLLKINERKNGQYDYQFVAAYIYTALLEAINLFYFPLFLYPDNNYHVLGGPIP